jgi:4-hydroxy-tetrahydrodipicolinate synthase
VSGEHVPLRGYYPIMATPYARGGEVDLDSVTRLVHYLIDSGAQGMSPNGGDSEAQHLTVDERRRILETVVAANAGRTPVLAGTSAVTVEDALELNRQAQAIGVDAVFVHPGWGRHGLSADEIVAFYGAVCDAIDLPIMVHGTGDMDVAVITALIDRFPQIAYVKEETSHGPKLRRYVREFGDRITVFGPGLHYPAELQWGALGVMPSCCAPHAHARVFELWQGGEQAEARREWNRMLPLVFWRWHTAAGEAGKLYLAHLGVFATPLCRQQVALPGQHEGAQVSFGTLRLDEADKQEMLTILDTMGRPPY